MLCSIDLTAGQDGKRNRPQRYTKVRFVAKVYLFREDRHQVFPASRHGVWRLNILWGWLAYSSFGCPISHDQWVEKGRKTAHDGSRQGMSGAEVGKLGGRISAQLEAIANMKWGISKRPSIVASFLWLACP